MNHIANIKELFDGKTFVNGEWVSVEEVEDSEPEEQEPVQAIAQDGDGYCGDDTSPPSKEDIVEAVAETIEETESEDVKDEREVQVDVGLEPDIAPPPSLPSDAAPMPGWWATVMENLEVLVDMPEPEEPEAQMSFTLDRNVLDQFVKACEKLKLEEVNLRMSEENGLGVREVDASHVMMTEVDLREEAISWGESETETTEMDIGLDIARVRQSLDALMDGELTLTLEDRLRGIHVTQCGDVETSHELSPVDNSGWSDPKRPQLNLPLEFLVELDTKVLNYVIKFLKDRSTDHVAFEWDPKEEGKLSLVKLINDHDDEIRAKVEGTTVQFSDEKVRSLFPTDYLVQVFQVCKDIKAEVVSIHLGQDYPIEIQANGENIRLNALLAPRIETGD